MLVVPDPAALEVRELELSVEDALKEGSEQSIGRIEGGHEHHRAVGSCWVVGGTTEAERRYLGGWKAKEGCPWLTYHRTCTARRRPS